MLYLFFNLKNLNYIKMTSVIYSLLLIFVIIARVLQNDFFQYFTKTHWWNILFENILIFPRLAGDYLDEISRLQNFQQMESWRTHLNNWGNAQISLAYANVG